MSSDNIRDRRFWALVALNLTVAARDTYELQAEGIASPTKLRAYNEMLHRVCSYMATEDSGSDEWLFSYLSEASEQSGTATSVEWALENAKRKVRCGPNQ
jgi:hypothetical protein